MRILMVCLGNICRSPLAEGIMKHKIQASNLNWTIDSAGTGSYHAGELPDSRSIAVAKKYDIDITDQRARQFVETDFDEFDKIYVMDSSNYQNVMKLARKVEDRRKVDLIMNMLEPGRNVNVPDPYWNDNGFELIYKMLDKGTDEILETYAK